MKKLFSLLILSVSLLVGHVAEASINVGVLPHPTFNSDFLSGALDSRLTHSRGGNATQFDSAGKIVYAPSNMVLNSATLTTQSITVISGAFYTLSFKGTGSVAISNAVTDNLAGTGAAVRVSKNLAAASTTTLTLTVTGTVTEAQLEITSYNSPQPYIPTTTAAVYGPRFDYAPATLALKGLLLEGQRQNYCYYGSAPANAGIQRFYGSLTATGGLAPDGITTMARGVLNASGLAFRIPMAGILGGTAVSFSFWARVVSGSITGVNVDIGDGSAVNYVSKIGATLTRVSAQITTGSTSGTGVDFVITGANGTVIDLFGYDVEPGAFPTSYIPTTGAAATRLASSLNSTDISAWFNPTEGSFEVEWVHNTYASAPRVVSFSDGTANNAIEIVISGDKVYGQIVNGGTAYTSAASASLVVGQTYRAKLFYKSGANRIVFNDATQLGDGTFKAANVPSGINRVDFLNAAAGTFPYNTHLRRFNYVKGGA